MASETTFKRSSRSSNRVIRNALAVVSAREALGPIERGCEIYALSAGQFSLVDAIQHVLEATGPARVTISTWTAAAAELGAKRPDGAMLRQRRNQTGFGLALELEFRNGVKRWQR